MASTVANPTATITNNLGYDVDIYDVVNPNANLSTQGRLTYTKLATVSNGASAQQVSTIHFASQLQAMRTGDITALNNNYYLQFPVAVLPVSSLADSTAFTLTSDMQQGMEDSFRFIRYIQANASSQMTRNFRTALFEPSSQKDAVNKFFQDTASFKKCTLTTWRAVLSWQAQFTNPWQGTYYLYSLGSNSAGSNAGSSAPALIATLAIVANAQADSAVLTMAGTNDEHTSVVMGGDGAMQEENQGTGNLSVALTPTWLYITQTSQQDSKTTISYVIGAAFTGTINGVKVAGNLNKLAIPKPSDGSSNAKDKNWANIFTLSSFSELTGMLTSIGMLYYTAAGHKQAEMQRKNDAQEKAKNKADAEKSEKKIEADYQNNEVALQRSDSVKLQNSIVVQVLDGYRQVGQAADIQNKLSTVEEQINKLMDILQGGAPSQATENAAEDLAEARANLQQAMDPATSVADRDVVMKDVSTKLTNTGNELKTELKQEDNNLSQEEHKTLSDITDALDVEQEQADAAKENEKEQEDRIEDDQDKEVDEDDFKDPEPEDPPEFVGPMEI